MKLAINELTGCGLDYAVANITGALRPGVYAVCCEGRLFLHHMRGGQLSFNPSRSMAMAGVIIERYGISIPDGASTADVPRLVCEALVSRAAGAAIDVPAHIVRQMLQEH